MCFVVIPLYHIFEVTSLFIGSYHFNTYTAQPQLDKKHPVSRRQKFACHAGKAQLCQSAAGFVGDKFVRGQGELFRTLRFFHLSDHDELHRQHQGRTGQAVHLRSF